MGAELQRHCGLAGESRPQCGEHSLLRARGDASWMGLMCSGSEQLTSRSASPAFPFSATVLRGVAAPSVYT